MDLSQAELAAIITDHRANNGHSSLAKSSVSRWECEQLAPSISHRLSLQGIAAEHGNEDLARIFAVTAKAPPSLENRRPLNITFGGQTVSGSFCWPARIPEA
jgi:hypothetical protein